MTFEFATAGRIVFGAGRVRELGAIAAGMIGDARPARALLVCGQVIERAAPVVSALREANIGAIPFCVAGEPTVETAKSGVERVRAEGCTLVVGYGGGSALDTGKAIAALLTNPGDILDYLEVIGLSRPLRNPPLPYLAVPTTAGTGAEVTRNSVLASPEHRVKVSLRSPLMLPRVALVDPELTYDLPPAVTASTGLDALTQLIEAYVGTRANPMTDAVCREGIARAGRSLLRAYRDAERAAGGGRSASPDTAAREDMCVASLFGGLALANAGLGAVHGFAGPIGGMFPAPHGAVCAALLPHVIAANVRALRQADRRPSEPEAQARDHGTLARYAEIARLLTGREDAATEHAVAATESLCRELQVPPLRTYGLRIEDVPTLVEKARAASSMKPNPVVLTAEQLSAVLTAAL